MLHIYGSSSTYMVDVTSCNVEQLNDSILLENSVGIVAGVAENFVGVGLFEFSPQTDPQVVGKSEDLIGPFFVASVGSVASGPSCVHKSNKTLSSQYGAVPILF